jgi:hypothetical protein
MAVEPPEVPSHGRSPCNTWKELSYTPTARGALLRRWNLLLFNWRLGIAKIENGHTLFCRQLNTAAQTTGLPGTGLPTHMVPENGESSVLNSAEI